MRLVHLLIVLATLLLAISTGTPSQAFDQKTTWYTLRVMPPNDASPLLFLTQTSNGLRLERYRSGDPTQQWALVQPDYPTGAAVTGSGPLDGIFDKCFNTFPPACDFKGHAGESRELRLVSHTSGFCVAVGATRATSIECSLQPKEAGWERLNATIVSSFNGFTSFATKNGKCLAANTDDTYADGMRVRAIGCGEAGQWQGQFIADMAAELTCRTDWAWNLCYVEGQGR